MAHPLDPEDQYGQARIRLLMAEPNGAFFGTLAMHLEPIPDPSIPTLCTNGVYVKYNPQFFATLTKGQQVFCIAHEAMHPALLHPYRMGGRDHDEWNEAGDFAINGILIKAGFEPPSDILHDPQYDGWAAEEIYSKRHMPKPRGGDQGQGKPGQESGDSSGQTGQGQPGQPGKGKQPLSTGTFEKAPDPATEPGTADQGTQMTEDDWKIAAEQASRVAAAAGILPGDADRAIRDARKPQIDWRSALRDFISRTIPSNYSWTSPNRRFISQGIYLPGLVKENIGPLFGFVDTSGSITQDMLNDAGTEVTAAIQEAMPEYMDVVYIDTKVQHTERFLPFEQVTLHAKGGGGTNFKPAFDWADKQPVPPVAAIYFTDLENSPSEKLTEPPYPVLWVTPEWVRRKAPFGEHIRIPAGR